MNVTGNTMWKKFGISCATIGLLVAGFTTASAQSKFSMSALLTPGYIRASFPSDQEGRIFNNSRSLGTGAMLHYQFSDQWSATSGLGIESRYSLDGDPNASFQTHYFNIPLLLNYQATQKRLSPYYSAGVQLNKLQYLYFNYGPQTDIVAATAKPRVRAQYMAGAGLKYQFNEHLALTTQPIFMYGSEDGDRNYQYSLQTQLVCRF
jgi:hypothetical protein